MNNRQKYELIKKCEREEAKNKSPEERARENFDQVRRDLDRLADEGMPLVSFYTDEKGKTHFKMPPYIKY